MGSSPEVVLIRDRVGLQIRPQVEHQIRQQWHNKPILFFALVDNVQGLSQILSEDVECLQTVAQVIGRLVQVSVAIQLIDAVCGVVRQSRDSFVV